LFSNRQVADLINANFVAGWEKVRDVPRVTIDFGGGRRLTRTLNGNIATYLVAPDGRVFDLIPGLYDAPGYLARLREGLLLYRGARESADFAGAVAAYHRSRLAGEPTLEQVVRTSMMRKWVVENPIKRALDDRMARYAVRGPAVAPKKEEVEAPVKRAVITDTGHPALVDALPIEDADALYNEAARTPAARRLLAAGLPTVADCYKSVYREILGTDLDDPYLGLAPAVPGGEGGREE
jgi:hypothetical protein